MLARQLICTGAFLLVFAPAAFAAEEPLDTLATIKQKCAKCHGQEEVNGEVNFQKLASAQQFTEDPELLLKAIEAIDAYNMPPDGERELDDPTRTQLLAGLKALLRQAAGGVNAGRVPIRRLNRFQYNNTVKDLFQLDRDIFPLPEKLMARHDAYLVEGGGTMPDTARVVSDALQPHPGLEGGRAFTKDLRGSHGIDNQANQLTLSPLLLDAYLKLSVSIVESPDFNQQTVGIWKEFFAPPEGEYDPEVEVRRRLEKFLPAAFRGPADKAVVDRYTAYTAGKIRGGQTFTESMRKAASAALSSPLFLYRSNSATAEERQFVLASDLSYFLWGSCPDEALLQRAERGELAHTEVLERVVTRMLADPKAERFLDSFPAQWMQLENALAATPDAEVSKYFNVDPDQPASAQMVLEPLLLFDAAFLENRPIVELIAPSFTYRSDFLTAWYESDLQPPPVNIEAIVAENEKNQKLRTALQRQIDQAQSERDGLLQSVRQRLLAAREGEKEAQPPLDLKPIAAWEINGDLKESLQSLDLTAHGEIEFDDGAVVLKRAYLLSKVLPVDLKAKTLEVWCKPHDLNQRGGGVMGIQGQGDFFDTIVLGERQPRHWISGSNGFSRTLDFPASTPEEETEELLHLVMVYNPDGTTRLYRNGVKYGEPFRKGQATFPKEKSSVIFGLRHLPPGGNKYLSVSIDKARLYDRALSAEEVAASAAADGSFIPRQEAVAAMTDEQRSQWNALGGSLDQLRGDLKLVPPPRDPNRAQAESRNWFEQDLRNKLRATTFRRVPVKDLRYGGIITNAAMMSMTSGPKRTHPVARGVWVIEVIFNDPPPPPPNDVPPLDEEAGGKDLTIREKFAAHRDNRSCAGCHARLDPLGFALENYDVTGRWREEYQNGRTIDASGKLMKKHEFNSVVEFKNALVEEDRRFAKAFSQHLLRFALGRELNPSDALAVDEIVATGGKDNYRLQSLIRAVVLSDSFRGPRGAAPSN